MYLPFMRKPTVTRYLCTLIVLLFFSAGVSADILSHSERSRGTKINDRDIEKHLSQKFAEIDPKLAEPNIRIVSFNQTVLIIGRVESEAVGEQAVELAKKAPLVRSVHDRLQVAGSISGLARTSDWVTQLRVRRAIKKLRLEADFQVTVEHGQAYLMGLVTPQQGELMTDAARKVDGVTKVVTVFEPLP